MAGRAPPGAVTRRGRAAQRVVAGREDVRTPARPVVALSASFGPRWGRPSSRSSGRPASARPVSRRPVHPGVRTDTLQCPRRSRRAVCAALDPGVARCGGPPRPGAAGRRAAVGHGRRGCLPASGRTGRGRTGGDRRWPWLARTRVDRSQGPPPGRGFPAAAPLGRRAGCRPGGGAWEGSRCSPALQVSWAVVGVVPDHGPGLGGGDHAGWSVGWWWSRGVQLRRVHAVRWGAACGRSAAAADKERRPPGTERALARENSGGRDRV
jgi:hypothetical protein